MTDDFTARTPMSRPLAWSLLTEPCRFWLIAVLVAALTAVFAAATASAPLGLFHDDGIYAVTAKSLAEGSGYRIVSLPGSPVQTKYPIAYPFLLSLVWRAAPDFPSNVLWLKAVGTAALGLTLLLSAGLLRRLTTCTSPRWEVPFLIIVGLNPLLLSTTDLTLSDGLFTALTLGLLLVHRDASVAPGLLSTCAAALLSALAAQTRQAGIAFVAAGLLWAWRRGKWHATAYLSCAVLPFLIEYAIRASGNRSTENALLNYYIGYETPLLLRLMTSPDVLWNVVSGNIGYVRDSVDTFFLFGTIPGMRWLYLALIVAGVSETARRGGQHLVALLAFYFAVVLPYPFIPTRYLLPVVPLTVLSLFNGVAAVERSLRRVWTTGPKVQVFAAIPVLMLVGSSLAWANWYRNAPTSALRLWTGIRASYGWNGFTESFAWVTGNTHGRDVIATAFDPAYYLYTGRRAIRPWLHQPDTYFYPRGAAVVNIGSAAAVRDALDRLEVSYLAIDPLDGFVEKEAAGQLFSDLVREYGARAELAFESSDHQHRIYRIIPKP